MNGRGKGTLCDRMNQINRIFGEELKITRDYRRPVPANLGITDSLAAKERREHKDIEKNSLLFFCAFFGLFGFFGFFCG
jgi:hypothetical protein